MSAPVNKRRKLSPEVVSSVLAEKTTMATRSASGAITTTTTTTTTTSITQSRAVHSFFRPRDAKPKTTIKLPSPPSVEHWVHLDPFAPASAASATPIDLDATVPSEAGPSTPPKLVKIAFYDLDGTLIRTRSGHSFPSSETDWTWWHPSVRTKLSELHKEGYHIVIISNQNLKEAPLAKWRLKIPLICQDLPADLPIRIVAAKLKDGFRKPMLGMLDLVKEVYAKRGLQIDIPNSFYVGDAAGRKGDHSSTDRKWAYNAGLTFFTPEQHFRGMTEELSWGWTEGFNARKWLDETEHAPLVKPTNTPLIPPDRHEVVLFVGPPAAGKTTFYQTHFKPKGYVHVNQDTLKSRDACLNEVRKTITTTLNGCVVDNTNRDVSTRALYVTLAKQLGVSIRCFHFDVPFGLAAHNNMYRAYVDDDKAGETRRTVLPATAFATFNNQMQTPTKKEGFADVKTVAFKFHGTDEEKERWMRWTS